MKWQRLRRKKDAYRCTNGSTTVGDCISQKRFLRLNNRPTDRPSFHQVLKICFSLMPVYGFWPNQTDSSRAAGAARHTMLRRISSRFHRTRKDPCADVHTQEAEPRVRFTAASIVGNNSPFLFHFHPLYLPHLRTTYRAAIALYLGCPHKQGMHSMGVCVCMCVPPH